MAGRGDQPGGDHGSELDRSAGAAARLQRSALEDRGSDRAQPRQGQGCDRRCRSGDPGRPRRCRAEAGGPEPARRAGPESGHRPARRCHRRAQWRSRAIVDRLRHRHARLAVRPGQPRWAGRRDRQVDRPQPELGWIIARRPGPGGHGRARARAAIAGPRCAGLGQDAERPEGQVSPMPCRRAWPARSVRPGCSRVSPIGWARA